MVHPPFLPATCHSFDVSSGSAYLLLCCHKAWHRCSHHGQQVSRFASTCWCCAVAAGVQVTVLGDAPVPSSDPMELMTWKETSRRVLLSGEGVAQQ